MTRSTLIPIRMNADEIRVLRAAASRAGLGIGPWLRMLGLREAQSIADLNVLQPKTARPSTRKNK